MRVISVTRINISSIREHTYDQSPVQIGFDQGEKKQSAEHVRDFGHIASGAFGSTYRASDGNGLHVAIKVQK